MNCARCGEEITSPYFFEGKAFGYTCIKIVNPLARKKKGGVKEHWVQADGSDFINEHIKQEVTAHWNGRKFKFWIIPGKTQTGVRLFSLATCVELGVDGSVYINLAAYKSYPKILEPKHLTAPAPVTG